MLSEKIKIQFAQKVQWKYANELKSKILYISNEIIDFDLQGDLDYIDGIELIICSANQDNNYIKGSLDKKKEDLTEALELFLQKDFYNRKSIKETFAWNVSLNDLQEFCHFETLIDNGLASEAAPGQIILGEPLISLFEYLDKKLKCFATDILKAVEYQYPTMINKSVVDKCGFINNSPHLLYFVNSLHHDTRTYCEFLNKQKVVPSSINEFLDDKTEYCLPPTMCYHTYCQFAGKELPPRFIVTSVGKAFRNESRYAKGMERMIDFTIREIVFFGEYTFVQNVRNQIIEFGRELFEDLHISGYCCSANDIFFLAEGADMKIKMQKQLKFKMEFCAYTDMKQVMSVGSVNYHDGFFANNFGLTMKHTKHLVSGCAGFGLERLLFAFISQHGINPDKWPIKITNMEV